MEDNSKTIKQEQGALSFNLTGKNQVILNWNDGIIEIFHNGKRKFIIDLNKPK